ncbi:disease resistance protein RPM1 [Eucalyptus grandis]|uniref:disease resistance protein RPM1 n=1 Tax=Eucalyptus grandis TaxID=71139 RepID=UPI00192E75FE|nr:disease resistance protein RPM1 [Eucalyptus grandis]
MADSAVSFLIEKLAMFVEKEVKLLKGVRGEIELIRDEFERMKAFLECADSSQEDDPELKVWVKHVRDVAFDVEDILDEFTLNLARDHGDGVMRYFHKIKPSIKNLKARHRLSSKITDIKSRVSSISEGHQRYHFKSYCTEQSASASIRGTSWHYFRENAFLIEEGKLVGIDEPKEELIKWLVDEEPKLEVVSISGMGGSGKTTLAKRVYDNPRVKTYFQSHAWIGVSQSYKIQEILRDMIEQLHGEIKQPAPQGIESMNSMRLKQIMKDFLQQKRYVIVLDDIWNLEVLEAIKNAMPNSNCSSRIIITTRIADIATDSSNQSKVYTLKPLSPKESWLLFCEKAFRGKSCPPDLENLSGLILKKCEGLPLAIVAIGSLLFAKNVREWEMISRSLGAELESNDRMQNFRKILSLSYNDLDCNLKSCFLYLGVFPEDHVIECMRLIRLWIAEGLVKEREGLTQEEVAERYLKELINRNLVQIAQTTLDGRLKSCRVHDLMRESILSKLRDENFVSFAFEQKTELHERVRRMSVQYTCNNSLNQLNLPSLRSLLIFELGMLSSLDEQFFPSASKLLRVLDLRGSSLHKFPQQIVVMFHLKYLSLRETNVRIIPRSIGKLQNLETLDLKYTLVSELPVEITKLKKLQFLLVYSYAEITTSVPFGLRKGFTAPQGIGALASLQKLSCIKAGGCWSKNIMRELGELSQLRRLGVRDLKKDDAKELCHSLEKMTNLRSLDVAAKSESEVIDLDFLSSPPLLLQVLYIEGCLKELPHWLPLLNNLVKVRLGWSKLESSPLIALQKLPNLVELELTNAFNGGTLVFGDGGFPKLKDLWLVKLENLRFVLVKSRAMPCLQSLSIHGCRHLDWQSLVLVLHGLTLANLNRLQFYDMPEEFVLALYPCRSSTIRKGILQELYEEVMERIPEVYFNWWEEDHWMRYDLSFDSYQVIKSRVIEPCQSDCSGLSFLCCDECRHYAFEYCCITGKQVHHGLTAVRSSGLLANAFLWFHRFDDTAFIISSLVTSHTLRFLTHALSRAAIIGALEFWLFSVLLDLIWVLRMALPPVSFRNPKDWDTVVAHHRFPGQVHLYDKYFSTIWVDKGSGEWIPHRFLTWFIRDGDLLIGPLQDFDRLPSRGLEDADWDPMELDPHDGAVENLAPASPVIDSYTSDYDSTEFESAGSE